MSLVVTLSPASRVLAGNPVRLDVSADSETTFQLAVAGTTVYQGSGFGTYFVYLQDLILPYLKPQVLYSDDENLLIPVTGVAKACTVTVTDGTDTRTLSFTAYPGGLSRSVLRALHESNPFTARFLSPTGNIFFSLRGRGQHLFMRETELVPLVFIYPPSGSLSITAAGKSMSLSGTASQLYALNLERVRRTIYDDYGILAPTFDLMLSGQKVITLSITPSFLTHDRYLIRYLSSLGTYDILECTGLMRRSLDESDEMTYSVFDKTVDGYVSERRRKPQRLVLKVSSGLMDEDRLLLFLDMLSSQDVTLLGYRGQDIRVIPSTDGLNVPHNGPDPFAISIDLRAADEDSHLSIDDVSEQLGSGSLHTSQFTSQFI